MRTEHLNALLVVAQTGSINKASKLLHINQQQLSKIIQGLEKEFGCAVFERTPKGVTPTPAGKDILDTASRVCQQLEALQTRLAQTATLPKSHLTGTLVIYSTSNVWPTSTTLTVIDAFTSRHPNVSVSLNELPPLPMLQALSEHPEHLGIIIKEKTQIGTPLVIPPEFTFLPLHQHKLVVLTGVDSDYAKTHKSTSLKAILKEPLVVYRLNSEHAAIDPIFEPLGGAEYKYSVSNLTTFHDILRKGKAIAVGIQKSPHYLAEKQLTSIPIRENIITETGFLLHKDHCQDPLISAFVAFYLDYCRLQNAE